MSHCHSPGSLRIFVGLDELCPSQISFHVWANHSLCSEDPVTSFLTGRHFCEKPLWWFKVFLKKWKKSTSTHNPELQRAQIRILYPRAINGIPKPSPRDNTKEQKGCWITMIYTILWKFLYQSMQPHGSMDCDWVKLSSSKQTKHLCSHFSAGELQCINSKHVSGASSAKFHSQR